MRLPKSVVPSHYNLRLVPDLEKFTFEGTVEIDVHFQETSNAIHVNSAHIEVQSAEFVPSGSSEPQSVQTSLDAEQELATFSLASPAESGSSGTLRLSFTGLLSDSMRGFYRAKYSLNGEDRYMAVTQFEACDARRAFPCFDEPCFKATFSVSLVAPDNKVVLSNMPVVSENIANNGKKEFTFDKTPKMSTYLLAFCIGDFDYVESETKEGVKVRVYTPIGRTEEGRFALEVGTKCLSYFTEYFNIGYPLPKMDMVALSEFEAGAMENWGLVTYREVALLIDQKKSSAAAKRRVAITVTHELAHQWFGNLVTMDWWEGLWLNEGFASWVSYLATDHLFPEWDSWTHFLVSEKASALRLDALTSSHPIEVPIGDAKEVDEIFDAISYCKGASAINLIHSYLGADNFRDGLRLYLKRHAYGNTQTADLWNAWSEVSKEPVSEIMSCWTRSTGYPVVRVSVEDAEKGVVSLKQFRFLDDGVAEKDETQWMIPLNVVTSHSKEPTKILMKDKVSTHTIGNFDWLKINFGQASFFRTYFDLPLLQQLSEPIRRKELSAADRLGTINDAFALARAREHDVGNVLEFLYNAYKGEKDASVWQDIATSLDILRTVLINEPEYIPGFNGYVSNLFSDIFADVGWEGPADEDHNRRLLRSTILGTLASVNDSTAVTEARRRFEEFRQNPDSPLLPSDIRTAVYKMVLQSGDKADYDNVLSIYKNAKNHEEKMRVLSALGAISNEKLMQDTLDMCLDADTVLSQDAPWGMMSVAANPKGGLPMAWQFVRDRWDVINSRWGKGFLITVIVRNTTSGFASEARAAEVKTFFDAHMMPSIKRTVAQSLEKISSSSKWLDHIRAGNLPLYLRRFAK